MEIAVLHLFYLTYKCTWQIVGSSHSNSTEQQSSFGNALLILCRKDEQDEESWSKPVAGNFSKQQRFHRTSGIVMGKNSVAVMPHKEVLFTATFNDLRTDAQDVKNRMTCASAPIGNEWNGKCKVSIKPLES